MAKTKKQTDEVIEDVESAFTPDTNNQIPMETDVDGNSFLPTMEEYLPVEIKPLIEAVINQESVLKPAFTNARNELIKGKEIIAAIAHKNIDHFKVHPDKENVRTYAYKNVTVTITLEQEKIETKLIKEADED